MEEDYYRKILSNLSLTKMHIQPKEYLALLDEIDYLKKDNLLLKQQNVVLTQKIAEQQQKRLQQEQNAIKNLKKIEELHAQTITYEHQQKQQIMEKISQMEKQSKQYLQGKFNHLENSSLTQVKSLELENAKNKLQNLQLRGFVNKVKALYDSTLGLDEGKAKKDTSLSNMIKWLKSIPGVAVNLNKTTSSFGFNSLKKQSSKKRGLKQNRSVLNFQNSKSRMKY